MSDRRATPRAGVAIAVALTLAVHLLAWWALHAARATPRRTAPSPRRVDVRLVLPSLPAAAREEAQTRPRSAPRASPPRSAAGARSRDQPIAPWSSAISLAPAASAAASSPLLDLQWHGSAPTTPSVRTQALNDTRANTPHLSPTERLAQTLGSMDTLVEENRGPGRTRIRKGRNCIDLRDAVSGGIDPFNQALRPTPKLGEDCSR